MAEREVQAFALEKDMPFYILRPTGVYGLGDTFTIYELMWMVEQGLLFFVPGSGSAQLMYTHVSDVCRGILCCVCKGPPLLLSKNDVSHRYTYIISPGRLPGICLLVVCLVFCHVRRLCTCAHMLLRECDCVAVLSLSLSFSLSLSLHLCFNFFFVRLNGAIAPFDHHIPLVILCLDDSLSYREWIELLSEELGRQRPFVHLPVPMVKFFIGCVSLSAPSMLD
jgi:NAD dependent epimerase/dehydratase family